MRRDLCESAKRGHLCVDDLCHGNPDDTLCGFDQSLYEEITEEYESEQYEDDDDCMDCGQCDSCIERTRAYFEEMDAATTRIRVAVAKNDETPLVGPREEEGEK